MLDKDLTHTKEVMVDKELKQELHLLILVYLDLVQLLELFLVVVELVKHNKQQILTELDRLVDLEQRVAQLLEEVPALILVVEQELGEMDLQEYLVLVDPEQL